jgi:hypothetical protein
VAIDKAGGKCKAHSGYLDSQSFSAARNQWPKISGSKSMTKNQWLKINGQKSVARNQRSGSAGLAADFGPLPESGLIRPGGLAQGEPDS